jgi:hypothetical protein
MYCTIDFVSYLVYMSFSHCWNSLNAVLLSLQTFWFNNNNQSERPCTKARVICDKAVGFSLA